MSKVFKNIIHKFFLEKNLPFDILLYKQSSAESYSIVNDILSKNNDKLYHYKVLSKEIDYFQWMLIFCETIKEFAKLIHSNINVQSDDQPVMHFVYISNVTFEELSSLEFMDTYRFIDRETKSMFHHAFYIINEPKIISLSTVEWFSDVCSEAVLTKINTFDKIKMKWTKMFQYYEKFRNFNNCELTMMIPIAKYPNEHFWGNVIEDEESDYEINGITPIVFHIMSKQFNFKAKFFPFKFNDFFEFGSVKIWNTSH